MIDTQAIRSKILDLAMRGQLTEQLPEDGTAEELYQQILEEKQKLIKEGKIKKEKPLPEITDKEIPFEIPENWKWVRLKELCTKIVDGDHNPPAGVKEATSYLMLSAQNINRGTLTNLDNVRYLSADVFEEENKRTKLEVDDVLLTIVGTIGRSCVYQGGFNISFQRSVAVITTLIYCKFLKYAFDIPFIQNFMIDNATGAAQLGFYLNKLEKLLIPLPPNTEQKRIVKKIEQALSVLDTIDELQSQYADNLTALKSKLIDAAIQGKLTEQLPEDGTAEELYQQIQEEKQKLIKEGKIKKQKPLPEITDEEIPFDIPDNWKWTRFADILDVRDGTHDTPKYVTDGIPLVTSKNLRKGLIDFESAKLISYEDAKQINNRSRVDDGDILLAMIGTIGNPVLVKKDREFSIKNMALFKPIDSNLLDMSYVLYYLKNEERVMQEKARGGLQPFVSLKFLRTSIIPLPPLAEQKRIVQKLNELLPLCEN